MRQKSSLLLTISRWQKIPLNSVTDKKQITEPFSEDSEKNVDHRVPDIHVDASGKLFMNMDLSLSPSLYYLQFNLERLK